jgi:lysylphosphatidylglycerol synthetase-like protein (DUF2156 family)
VRRLKPAYGNLVALGLGLLALVAGTAAGWNETVNALLVSPPLAIRVLLGTAAAILGVALVLQATNRLNASREPADLVRAVRIVFLAVAAFAAAAGWLIGSALPIIAALVIAGVDVIETTFLLLVGAVRRGRTR